MRLHCSKRCRPPFGMRRAGAAQRPGSTCCLRAPPSRCCSRWRAAISSSRLGWASGRARAEAVDPRRGRLRAETVVIPRHSRPWEQGVWSSVELSLAARGPNSWQAYDYENGRYTGHYRPTWLLTCSGRRLRCHGGEAKVAGSLVQARELSMEDIDGRLKPLKAA